ncbi:MAG: alpha/beta hydrolase [Pseudomonadales bacterium]|nr:alpha/beta hydrolase [Pseudomonadales bacterium]RLU03500.1 MAG: alpha/beta fold hydrolase [Ketobacter sp.]
MSADTVVLLHGLGRSPLAMKGLERFLTRQGYHVINQGYSSRRGSIAELCRQLFHDLLPALPPEGQIHFVTHSLGGILLRYGLQHWSIHQGRLGRAVMLAPPSQGSEVVDILRHVPLLPRIMGPAFLQLGTDASSVPLQLLAREQGGLPIEVGVIAGRTSYEPWFSPLFGEDNDGKVSVSRSRHPGMKDFRALEVGHTFIMNDKRVRQHILHFLQFGRFK